QGHGHRWLQYGVLQAADGSWIAGKAPPDGVLAAKTRYRQADAPCQLNMAGDGGARFELSFSEPQWAVTPGQSAVLYDGEVCLGGGIIDSAA
ncbi:MAG: tRNA 2-thiouridine(34) synthase MnmA, partial [Rhodoferax sp.]|nr:tRNA 2-thiouridine(34) synthase MnmA [Rhodoferax sp.]